MAEIRKIFSSIEIKKYIVCPTDKDQSKKSKQREFQKKWGED